MESQEGLLALEELKTTLRESEIEGAVGQAGKFITTLTELASASKNAVAELSIAYEKNGYWGRYAIRSGYLVENGVEVIINGLRVAVRAL